MNKLARIITTLETKELVLIQKDLEMGTLQRLIQERLEKAQQGKNKICPVCTTTIKSNQAFKLEYGSSDLRRVAHFDAPDCLEYFIKNNLKKNNNKQTT